LLKKIELLGKPRPFEAEHLLDCWFENAQVPTQVMGDGQEEIALLRRVR